MTGVQVDQLVFEYFLESYHPEVKETLKELNFTSENYATQWLVCLFANTFEFSVVFKLWDLIFIEGIIAVFKIALATVDLMREQILECEDMGAVFMLFKTFPKSLKSPIEICKRYSNYEIKLSTITRLRMRYSAQIYQEYEEQQFKNSMKDQNQCEKFLQKFYLFTGFSKMRGNGELPKEVLQNFDDEVVNGTE